jgi:hypothetical protein
MLALGDTSISSLDSPAKKPRAFLEGILTLNEVSVAMETAS